MRTTNPLRGIGWDGAGYKLNTHTHTAQIQMCCVPDVLKADWKKYYIQSSTRY